MKGLVLGFKKSHFEDGVAFLQILAEKLSSDLTIYGLSTLKDIELNGVEKIYVVKEDSPHTVATAFIKVAREFSPDLIVGPTTKNGTEIIVRTASELSIPMVTEASALEEDDELIIQRPVMGGRALASYVFKSPLAVTIPAKKFKLKESSISPSVEELSVEEAPVKRVEILPKEKGAVDIESAEIIVGAGRGFKAKEDLEIAFELAKLLGGEIGCSRPIAADMHWLGEDRWIGISGKKIKGKLYIAIGISGAPQHIMAASDSKVIVAVNKDKNAPIFTYADYGIVADLYQFIPVFLETLKKKKGS